jgi:threonine dehydrogenase-like Zn-dependent dehydrogenase
MANVHSIGNGGSQGGFAPYLLVADAARHEDAVLKLPAGLGPEQAAMVEPLSVAMHGCNQGQAQPGDKVVIFGAGPIGLCALTCLRYLGVDDIVVVDLSDFRLERANELGATTFNATGQDLAAFLIDRHGAADVIGMPVPATDLYLEATGAGPVFEQIPDLARTGARIVVLGVHKQPVQFDLVNLLLRELNIVGSMAYPNEFPQVIEMLCSGLVDTAALVSHRFPLSQFPVALAQARDAQNAVKVLVECQS